MAVIPLVFCGPIQFFLGPAMPKFERSAFGQTIGLFAFFLFAYMPTCLPLAMVIGGFWGAVWERVLSTKRNRKPQN